MLTDNSNTSNQINQEIQDPDGNRALLGWLTGMMEQTLPQDEMTEEGTEGEETEGQEMPAEQPQDMTGQMEQFKQEVQGMIQEGFSGIAEMIKQVIKEDETTDEEETE